MKPKILESDDVRRQLICAGVLEAIRIRQIGYPLRRVINEFILRYKPILSFNENAKYSNSSASSHCIAIMTKSGIKNDKIQYQIGQNKVFMKESCKQILEAMLGKALVEHTIIIQKCIRK